MVNIRIEKVDSTVPDLTVKKGQGVDLYARYAYLRKVKTADGLKPLLCYKLGIKTELPNNMYAQLTPRSSISKYTPRMANSVGIIDNDYRGEWEMRCDVPDQFKEILMDYFVNQENQIEAMSPEHTDNMLKRIGAPLLGERVAQFHLHTWIEPVIGYVKEVGVSDRQGGFGSTGTGLND